MLCACRSCAFVQEARGELPIVLQAEERGAASWRAAPHTCSSCCTKHQETSDGKEGKEEGEEEGCEEGQQEAPVTVACSNP
jgi:hypothetical protein